MATSAKDFVHLHVHTEYSMLDGAAKLPDLFEEVARQGQSAVAMTDHGYLFGAFDFWNQAKAAGVKPIIGVEAYLTPGTHRSDTTRVRWGDESQKADDVSAGGAYTHLTLWARNNTGLSNLFKASSLASLEGQMGKWPRMDRELLERYHEGLIASTGCPSGEVQTRLRLGQWDEALRAAGELQDIFGKEYFYVEVMDHGIDIERKVLPDLIRLAKTIGAPLLATNDLHYVRQDDAHFHDALLCINSGARLSEPDRFKFDGNGYYVKSAAQMRQLWADHPQACDNTLLVAEQCEVSFHTANDGANFMPKFDVPEGHTEDSWFAAEVRAGLERRYPHGVPDEVRRQAEYEVEVICQLGFAGYFLVVADFIGWARSDRGYPTPEHPRGEPGKKAPIRVGPGRGSAAGSMAAYAMGITDLDPLEHGLIFERFLNPERVSWPDVDVDFDERRRGEVIRYVTEKYGEDRVAQIVTFGTIKAKQALKDATRLLDFPYAMGDRLTKAMPPAVMGKDISLSGITDPDHERYGEAGEFRTLLDEDPDARQVFDLARGIEGLKRQWGVHAAGVIMSSHPLLDVIPIMRRPQDGAIITQFDQPTSEALGLLKMDFLGLRNLTVIEDALANIVANGKEPVVIEDVPFDDEATYRLLSRGDTLGVFQLDGGPMRSLLRQLRPDNFEDISALIALYRPGPMGVNSHINYALRKNGQQDIEPIHPELAEPLKEVLDETYGLIIYQEQVQKAAQILAGYSLGQADLLRRAMGKKKKEILDKEFIPFREGCRARGYSDEAIQAVWDVLVPFAGYAFNKAHSAAYGVISYWTAYLKANYPTEYMAALLTSVRDDKDKSALYLAECRHMGITVLPPDVNSSAATFTATGDKIRFGLGAVRNVGANVVDEIITTRTTKGAFTSFVDFIDKVPAAVCNKRTIESLIKAGAFDSLGASRRALMTIHEEAVDAAVPVKRAEDHGQFDLFADVPEAVGGGVLSVSIPQLDDWPRKQRLAFEREMLGLYVSDHPLNGLDHVLATYSEHSISSLLNDDHPEGASVKVAGLITAVERRVAKSSGKPWAKIVLEDMDAAIEVTLFGDTYQAHAQDLVEDSVVVVNARVRRRDDEVSLSAFLVTPLDVTHLDPDAPVVLTVTAEQCTKDAITQLRQVLSTYPGACQVHLRVRQPGKTTVLAVGEQYRVRRCREMYSEVKALFGAEVFGR